jgi:AraC-like DNA-binding protein
MHSFPTGAVADYNLTMPEFQNSVHAWTAAIESPQWEFKKPSTSTPAATNRFKGEAGDESPIPFPGNGRSIASIVAFMLGNLHKPHSVPMLSAMAGMSSSHFYARFKCETGFSPLDFFIRARINRACELLQTTAHSVKEISQLMGYEDQFYFSRRFKSVKGLAPKDYRRVHRRMTRDNQGESNVVEFAAEIEISGDKTSTERKSLTLHQEARPKMERSIL